jgi:flagellar motility protein MotE (MotC chaperone)
LQQILRQSEDREQPDFDEILEARKIKSYDMDMRHRSQKTFKDDLSTMLAELRDERDRFDERLGSFRDELEEIRQGAQREGLQDVQRTLQSLDAAQAKEQLLIMYEDERIDDVVTIVQAMSTDKRKDILAEFVSKDEAGKLAEILQRISDGMPTSSLINRASDDR